MTKSTGNNAFVWAGGYDVSRQAKGFDHEETQGSENITTIYDVRQHKHEVHGNTILSHSMSWDGWVEKGPGGTRELRASLGAGQNIVCVFGEEGVNSGAECRLVRGPNTGMGIGIDLSAHTTVSMGIQGSGDAPFGTLLKGLTTVSASGTDDSISLPAAPNGAVVVIFVFGATGDDPNASIEVDHSDDDDTFVGLAELENLDGSKLGMAIDIDGAVDEHLKVSWTLGVDTESLTFGVAVFPKS